MDLVARLDIPAVSPWRDQIAQIGLKATARQVRELGLRVSGMCRGGMFPANTQLEWETNLEDNLRALEEAVELNADCLVLVTGGLPKGSRIWWKLVSKLKRINLAFGKSDSGRNPRDRATSPNVLFGSLCSQYVIRLWISVICWEKELALPAMSTTCGGIQIYKLKSLELVNQEYSPTTSVIGSPILSTSSWIEE